MDVIAGLYVHINTEVIRSNLIKHKNPKPISLLNPDDKMCMLT